NPEHARAFAWSRAQPSRELGEVVGRVQSIDRGAPSIAVDEIVPIGNEISQRTAAVAEGNAAIHAARGLILQAGFRKRQVDLVPVVHAIANRPRRMLLALDFDEPRDLTHCSPPPPVPGMSPRVLPRPHGPARSARV